MPITMSLLMSDVNGSSHEFFMAIRGGSCSSDDWHFRSTEMGIS